MTSPISAHDVGLDPLGRLVEDQQLRIERQRAPHGQLLLLAARQIAAAPAQHLFSTGNSSSTRSGMSRLPRRAPAEADAQVLLDGERREDLPPLRHVADAGARPRVGRRAGEIGVAEADLARDARAEGP